jgi:hypothetical protein
VHPGCNGIGDGDGGASVDPPDTTNDRCNGTMCVPSKLLPQEDLEFLEDMGDGWLRLMEADWEVAPTSEGYRCMTLTVPEDVLITSFFPQSPAGTHHSTFGVSSTPQGPDAVVACGVGNAGERRLQGSGAGSEATQLPAGVAMRLRAGDQINMNLHLFNTGDVPLRGRSGMWIKTVAESEVEHEAETVLAGPLALLVPVGRSTQTGTCTLQSDATIFSVGPHMHQTGVHMRATTMKDGAELEIYDGDYDFFHQLSYEIDPVQLSAGDVVSIECTYENDTDRPISWGDSSLDEMCFISLGLYPAGGHGGGLCTN